MGTRDDEGSKGSKDTNVFFFSRNLAVKATEKLGHRSRPISGLCELEDFPISSRFVGRTQTEVGRRCRETDGKQRWVRVQCFIDRNTHRHRFHGGAGRRGREACRRVDLTQAVVLFSSDYFSFPSDMGSSRRLR